MDAPEKGRLLMRVYDPDTWGICADCNRPFFNKPKHRYRAKFCKTCGASRERRMVGVICQQCGKAYQRAWTDLRAERKNRPNKPEVCSGKCLQLLRGTQMEVACSECGRTFLKWHKYVAESKHHFCSKECQNKNDSYILAGPAHYRYKDGSGSLPRGKGWKQIQRQVRLRDEYTCQLCGISEPQLGKKLDVHHIRPFNEFKTAIEANHPYNLISLCASCHHRVEAFCATQPELMAEVYALNQVAEPAEQRDLTKPLN